MPKEGARGLNGIAIVISMAPDVCKTPVGPNLVPIPYPIVAMFSLATGTKPKVLFAKEPAFTKDSFIQQVLGDEAGVGGGVKSSTFKMTAKPIDFSATVRCNKQNVIRNGDKFEMNNGNTQGILVFILMGPAPVSPLGGIDDSHNPPLVAETKAEGGFLKGVTDRGGEVWDDLKGMGGTLRDAVGLGDQAGDAASAWGNIWEGTKGIGKLAGNAAVAAAGNTGPLAPLTKDLPIVNQAEDYLGQIGSAVVDDVKKGYTEAYAEGGFSQAAGRAVADVGKLAVEIFGAKGAGAAVKAAKGAKTATGAVDKVADAAKAIDKIEDATDSVGDVAKTGKALDDASGAAAGGSKGSGGGGSGSLKDKVIVSKLGPELPPKVANTFKDGKYKNRQLTKDEKFYKYHGTDNRTGNKTTWFSNKKYASEAELRSDLAIREDWGVKIDQVSEFQVPKGTWVSEGAAASQGMGYPGGGYQAVVTNVPRNWVTNTKPAF